MVAVPDLERRRRHRLGDGVSLLAYWAGKAVAEAINRYGLYGVIALIVARASSRSSALRSGAAECES